MGDPLKGPPIRQFLRHLGDDLLRILRTHLLDRTGRVSARRAQANVLEPVDVEKLHEGEVSEDRLQVAPAGTAPPYEGLNVHGRLGLKSLPDLVELGPPSGNYRSSRRDELNVAALQVDGPERDVRPTADGSEVPSGERVMDLLDQSQEVLRDHGEYPQVRR